MFCGRTVIYKLKVQLLTDGSSTKAEFIATHTAANIAHLQYVLKQLGYEQKEPTDIHIDNILELQIINCNTYSTDRIWYINIYYFEI